MVALAQTGTGKTAAFGFPVIQKIDTRNTQAFLQHANFVCRLPTKLKLLEIRKGINVVAIYGGASITDQAREIKRGAQIIVATQEECKT
jgi:ATP-dependent RNA helicase DeaD